MRSKNVRRQRTGQKGRNKLGKCTKKSRVIKLTSISDVERAKVPSRDTARKLLRGDKFSMNYHSGRSRV